jgi:hypothetical protein
MIKLYDRIKERSYTIGDGNFVLSGAFSGFASFDSVYENGEILFYVANDGNNYELGSGKYVSANNSLQRFPIKSSNSNNKVNFPEGLKEVYVNYPATNSVFNGSGIDVIPQHSGLPFWTSANSLSSENYFYIDAVNHRLGLNKPNPSVAIDIGGSNNYSHVKASGYTVGSSGIYFPSGNNGSSLYLGGTQLTHYERNEIDVNTGLASVIELSGTSNQYFLLRKQNAGTVFAGPPSGCIPTCEPNYPTFRLLVSDDLPDLSNIYSTLEYTIEVSGNLYNYILETSGVLNNTIYNVSGVLNQKIDNASGILNQRIQDASGILNQKIDNVSGVLNQRIQDVSGVLHQKIDNVSIISNENIQNVSGILNQKIDNVSGILNQRIQDASGILNQKIDNVSGVLNQRIQDVSGVLNNTIIEYDDQENWLNYLTHRISGTLVLSNSGNSCIGVNSNPVDARAIRAVNRKTNFIDSSSNRFDLASIATRVDPITTQNGYYDSYALYAVATTQILDGISNSGNLIGVGSRSLRLIGNANDDGNLSGIIGVKVDYGHGPRGLEDTSNKVIFTSESYGIKVQSFVASGTINTATDLYLDNINTGGDRGSINKSYGIVQKNTSDNVLGGKLSLSSSFDPTCSLDINSDLIRIRQAKTPSSTGDTGNICWDSNGLYVCTSTNNWQSLSFAGGGGGGVVSSEIYSDGRLSVSSTNPYADGTGNTIYYTKYIDRNKISLYNTSTSSWSNYVLPSNLSLAIQDIYIAIGDLLAQKICDIFIYLDPVDSQIKLKAEAWINITTRNKPLTSLSKDVYVLSEDYSKRYIGSIKNDTDTISFLDSQTNRLIYNAHNKIKRKIGFLPTSTTTWVHNNANWGQININSLPIVNIVNGISDQASLLDINCLLRFQKNSDNLTQYSIGVAKNSDTVPFTGGLKNKIDYISIEYNDSVQKVIDSYLSELPSLGLTTYKIMERSQSINGPLIILSNNVANSNLGGIFGYWEC